MSKGRSITIFIITNLLFWFSLFTYIPQLATYAKSLGASYKLIGIITGSYGVTQTLIRLPLGIWSDKINKRKIFVILGLFVSTISTLVTYFYPHPYSLLATRLLAGASVATFVVMTVMFADYYEKSEAARGVGISNSVNGLGLILAMAAGGLLIKYSSSNRDLYLLGAIGGFVGFVLSFFIEERAHEYHESKAIKVLFKNSIDKNLLKVSILATVSQGITFATLFGFVPIIGRSLYASGLQLSLLTITGLVPFIILPPITGSLFIRYVKPQVIVITGFIISTVICFLMPFAGSLSLLFLLQFFSGIGRSLSFPLLMGMGIKGIDSEYRGTAMGFFQASYGVGLVFGPVILGFMADTWGLTSGFIFTSITGIVAIFFIVKWFFVDPVRRNQ